jgi:histone H1/5
MANLKSAPKAEAKTIKRKGKVSIKARPTATDGEVARNSLIVIADGSKKAARVFPANAAGMAAANSVLQQMTKAEPKPKAKAKAKPKPKAKAKAKPKPKAKPKATKRTYKKKSNA